MDADRGRAGSADFSPTGRDTQYEAWFHAPHRGVTTCNDCHLPNGNPVAKWLEKARAGAKDTIKFWAGPQTVNMKAAESTRAVVHPLPQ